MPNSLPQLRPVAWRASTRFFPAKDTAPGTLGFVEDLLNTASLGKPRQPDLLAELDSAQAWLDATLKNLRRVDPHAPAELITLDGPGLRRLRALRDALRTALSGVSDDRTPTIEATTSASFSSAGPVLLPRGTGVEALRSYALIQLIGAWYGGTAGRLKVCANPRCQGAFYDRSKNCSRVWHDVTTCGNIENVRAYRARKRAQRGTPSC
jgi:CGNR zinc finger/Putative stress-induced transcription regulator